MKTVIVLWHKVEDDKCAAHIVFYLVFICVTEELLNSKLTALDPQLYCFTNCLKCHESTICPTYNLVWVIGHLHRLHIRF
jgi:hypothetical protein